MERQATPTSFLPASSAATAGKVVARSAARAAAGDRVAAFRPCLGRQHMLLLLLLLLVPQAATALPTKRSHEGAITPLRTSKPAAATRDIPEADTRDIPTETETEESKTRKQKMHKVKGRHMRLEKRDSPVSQHLPATLEATPENNTPAHHDKDSENDERVSSLDSDDSVSVVETNSKGLYDHSPDRFYVCRYGSSGQACGNRAEGPHPRGLHCLERECCSKTKCVNGQCGNYCAKEWATCTVSIVYLREYSYGSCTCEKYSKSCPQNSRCHDEKREQGGAYCTCLNGYVLENGLCVKK